MLAGHLPPVPTSCLAGRWLERKRHGSKHTMATRKTRLKAIDRDNGHFVLPDDTSLEAVGKRLKIVRAATTEDRPRFNKLWKLACPASEWRKWESGKSLIPRRNAWLISAVTREFGYKSWYPVEWIYTGSYEIRTIPSPPPELGDDLSGFAARVRQAREAFGITLADIKAIDGNGPIYFDHWKAFEAGLDEPRPDQMERLIERLEVDIEWLYFGDGTQTNPRKIVSQELPRWYRPQFHEGWYFESDSHLSPRLNAALELAGIPKALLKRLIPDVAELDAGSLMAAAVLCGVPLEKLLFDDAEIACLRRRIDRFKRRLGHTPPSKRRTSAA